MIRQFWAELNTPDDFSDKPYEGLINQLGHACLGAIAASYICVTWGSVFLTMPYKWAVFLGILAFYGGVIEWWYQRSSAKDGLTDTFFVGLGASVPLVSFTEVATHNDETWLRLENGAAIASLMVLKVCLAAYIAPRAWRKYRSSGND